MRPRRRLRTPTVALAWVLATVALSGAGAAASVIPPIVISARADATYQDQAKNQLAGSSQTVTITVGATADLTVTPHDIVSSSNIPPHTRVTELFRVCNTGNQADSFTVTSAQITAPALLDSLHFDADGSGIIKPGDPLITIGQTSSPSLNAGACIGLLAEVDANSAALRSLLTLHLTAQSNKAAQAQDQGTILLTVGIGPRFTSPTDPRLPPVLLADGQARIVAIPGQTLTYTIAFANSGDTAAQAAVITDDLPAALEYVAGSLVFGIRAGAASATHGQAQTNTADTGQVVGQHVEVHLQAVEPGEIVTITFQARLLGSTLPGAGVVDHAVTNARNLAAPAATTEAIVIGNPLGVVYVGNSGGAVKVSAATIILSTDPLGANPVALAPGPGPLPIGSSQNPAVTGAKGEFNFVLSPSQMGTNAKPATYFIGVTAAGFHRRVLQATVTATGDNLFTLTVQSADNQPIAQSGSFLLTSGPVQLNDLALLVLNIPLFETATFQVTKVADRQRATIGDAVSYRIEAHNTLASPLTGIVVRDRLPASFHYAAGTGRLITAAGISIAVEPEIARAELIFRIGSLDPGARVSVSYRVRVGANAVEGEQFNSATAEGTLPSGLKITSAEARVGVVVGQGMFGTQQVIIGRVFEDANRNGIFDKDELPIQGARLYLSNGDSVVTDSQGMYNFPLVKGGSVVISLDAVSIPAGYQLLDDRLRANHSWTRLLRAPLGGGSLLRQNFAVLPPDSVIAARRLRAGAITGKNDVRPTSLASQSSVQKETKEHLAIGTYEAAATEDAVPLAPGAIRIDSPAENQVILSPAMKVTASVYEDWTVSLEVNGRRVADSQIGERQVDHKNKISTFTFFGLNVRPGLNQIQVMAIGPTGKIGTGTTVQASVYGRGPAKRLRIDVEKHEMAANGRESTPVHILAFDQWEHPAADEQILVEVSSGSLRTVACVTSGSCPATNTLTDAPSALKTRLATLGLSGESNVAGADPDRRQSLSLQGGEAHLILIAGNAPGEAEIRALLGEVEGRTSLRFLPEIRPAIMVSLIEGSIGSAAPDRAWQDLHGSASGRASIFYRGGLLQKYLLTIAYDSHSRLHQAEGRNRLFQLDPQDRIYPLFGDSSTRFEAAPSNSKLYARLDRGPSFLLFGDFNPDQDGAGALRRENNISIPPAGLTSQPGLHSNTPRQLTGYSRNLTGIKIHGEDQRGDTLTITGARPETAFARDVFPGGYFGLIQLSQTGILPGSENVVLEVRDRRSPEIILSQETLIRSADYNLDVDSGSIFLLRPVSSFDYALNLLQIVVTYEYFAHDLSSAVYTARASMYLPGYGLRISPSLVSQSQAGLGAFDLAGGDLQKSLIHGGSLQLEWGMSHGPLASAGNLLNPGLVNGVANNAVNGDHNGNAYRAELTQPFSFYKGVLKATMSRVDANFLNPFGATVTPGSQRAAIEVDLKPRASGVLHAGIIDETNKTINVDNQRLTASTGWTETINAQFKLSAMFDWRQFEDEAGHGNISSHLVTVGGEWRPTAKISVAVKREQNLGQADPTYPDQTTLTASKQVSSLTRIFFTQRLAAAPIVPISDVSATGFASSGTRQETALGVETRVGRYTSLNDRYQIENGISGVDSYAVLGLVSRLPVMKTVSLDLGFERGEHLTGTSTSFESGSGGFSWLPTKSFRSTARYELRNRDGFGQIVTVGAAGKLGENTTVLGSVQGSQADFAGHPSSTMNATAALSVRPLNSDRLAVLFSYNRRSLRQDAGPLGTETRSDSLATDGLLRVNKQLEFYSHFAARFSADGSPLLAPVSTLTYLEQLRLQDRFATHFDAAIEMRSLTQAATFTSRQSTGAELGFWPLADLRLGGGYNFTGVNEPPGSSTATPGRPGFYFTISSKLSNIFNLFGTSRQGLARAGSDTIANDAALRSGAIGVNGNIPAPARVLSPL